MLAASGSYEDSPGPILDEPAHYRARKLPHTTSRVGTRILLEMLCLRQKTSLSCTVEKIEGMDSSTNFEAPPQAAYFL